MYLFIQKVNGVVVILRLHTRCFFLYFPKLTNIKVNSSEFSLYELPSQGA